MRRISNVLFVSGLFVCFTSGAFAQTEENTLPQNSKLMDKAHLPMQNQAVRKKHNECFPPCKSGYACKTGTCVSSSSFSRRHTVKLVDVIIDKKSVLGAFFLEFIFGFGVGNYYAGARWTGFIGTMSTIFGAVGTLMLVYGDGALPTVGYAFLFPGVTGKFISLVFAPYWASKYNDNLRYDYLRTNDMAHLDPTWRHDFSLHKYEHDQGLANANSMVFGVGLPPIRW